MSRPGFFFLICPDSQLIQKRIESLAAEHPPSAGGEFERWVFWAEEGLTPRFWEKLTLQSLMAKERMVVVRHAEKLLTDSWKQLSESLKRFIPEAWPVFCLESPADGKKQPKPPTALAKQPCWKFAEKKGWTWISKGLDEKSIRSYLTQWAESVSARFAPGVQEALQAALPPDASAVDRELEKLELALDDSRTVTREHLSLVAYTPDMSIFDFINALQAGGANIKVWRKALDARGDQMLFYFLTMLIREARILWQLAMGADSVPGLPLFAVQKKRDAAMRVGPEKLAMVWDLALAADYGVKSGEVTQDQAFERLLAGLAQLFGPSPAPAGRRFPR